MNSTKDTPIYNLKAVVQETGIKPDTLRAWERRYNLPSPKRTDSGHRLYSQNDIDMLHWLMARQDEGLSISRAAEMWQHMYEAAGSDEPPSHVRSPLLNGVNNPPPRAGDNTLATLAGQWVTACINFNQSEANQILDQAFALFATETVCLELIQKGLARIGDGWYQGLVTVQQEHFASSLAMRRLEALLNSTPPPTRSGRILIGNPPDEEHTFVPLLLSLLLRRRGWDVVYLGANVPINNLQATISSIRPNLIILTAQQLYTAATLLEMGEMLLQERVPLAYGGRVFNWLPDLRKMIPGYYLGDQLESSQMTVEQIMASLRLKTAQRSVPAEYRRALIHYRSRQAQIEAELWENYEQLGLPQAHLVAANGNLGRTISAALTLGDIDYMQTSLEWVQGMLVNHFGMASDKLEHYLHGYLHAASRHLDERGEMLLDWLAKELGVARPAVALVETAHN